MVKRTNREGHVGATLCASQRPEQSEYYLLMGAGMLYLRRIYCYATIFGVHTISLSGATTLSIQMTV
jgi:hypothetical protein